MCLGMAGVDVSSEATPATNSSRKLSPGPSPSGMKVTFGQSGVSPGARSMLQGKRVGKDCSIFTTGKDPGTLALVVPSPHRDLVRCKEL